MRGRSPTEAAAPELRVVEGPAAGHSVPLNGGVLIGRDRACDLLLADEEVSRRHVRVMPHDRGAWVEDLASTNGTYVNGERILAPRTLQVGDRVEVGDTVFELGLAGIAAPQVTAAAPSFTAMRQVLAQPSEFLTAETKDRKWWTLVVVCTASFMLLLDTTIVAVALPDISTSLGTTFSELQWVVNAYSLTLAAGLLTAGVLSDIIGRRHVFMLGVVVFTAASAVCGFAWAPTVLDLARAVQGLGGAMMLAPALALLAQEFPPAERANAFGIWGAVTAGAIGAGPLIGGLLTDTISWEAIFFVNVPIGILVVLLTQTRLVNLPGPPTSIDWAGLVTFSPAVFMLVFALIRGNDEGWSSGFTLSLLVGSAVMLVLFLLVETQVSAPMLDMSMFRKPTCTGASIVAFCVSASVLALIIYITLWLQSIREYSPLEAGLRLLPITALGLLLKPLAGRRSDKVPPRLFLGIGLVLVAAGLFHMSTIGPDSGWTALLPGLVLCGIGLGIIGPPLAAVAVGVVPPRQSGMASGINTTFRQLGLVTGIAALGAIFQHQVEVHVTSTLRGTANSGLTDTLIDTVVRGGSATFIDSRPESTQPALRHAARVGFSSGLGDILLAGGVVALAGAVAAFLLVRRKDLVGLGGPPPHAAAGPPPPGPPGSPAPAGGFADGGRAA